MRKGVRRVQRAISGEVLVQCTLEENAWQPCFCQLRIFCRIVYVECWF